MLKINRLGNVFLLIPISFLVGCASTLEVWHRPSAKLPSRHQVCTSLKHQIIFKNNAIGPNILQSTPIDQARVMNEYLRYNCDQLEL